MTDSTADLIVFLRARLDEDEQAARNAHAYDIEAEAEDYGPTTYQVAVWAKAEPPIKAFVDRMSPARVLREVEAKRRLLEEFAHYEPGDDGYPEFRMAVRLAALSYSGHDDYREEWRP